jgi:diguanylate cyclase (GGDEF)-like protein/PAS domain S-box-containing protein
MDTMPPSAPGRWHRGAIEEHVGGKTVWLRDATSALMETPPWIASAAAGVATLTAGQRVAAVHPDDRGALTETFIEALGRPGEIVSISYRILVDGRYVMEHLDYLNLLDQPDVNALISTGIRDELDGEEVEVATGTLHGEGDDTHWMLANLDMQARMRHVEGKVQEILGRSAEEVKGRNALAFFHSDGFDDSMLIWLSMLEEQGATRTSRRFIVHPDGTERWIETTYLNRFQPDGTGDVLALLYDITERHAQEEALRISHDQNRHLAEELRLLADEVPSAVFRCDVDGRVTFHNARWTELMEMSGHVVQLQEIVHPDDRFLVDEALASLAGADGTDRRTIQVLGAWGDRVLAIGCRPVHQPGSDQHSVVGSIDDVTDAVALERRATLDALTGLLNRAAIDERITAVTEHGDDESLLVFIDLDGFKGVNDTFGHEAGDTVLKEVSRRLRRGVRPEDQIGRYGGDEFVILCRSAGDHGEASIRERLVESLDDIITWPGGSWQPAASIGTARLHPGDDAVTLVRRADMAMFAIKEEHHRLEPTGR